MLNARSKYLQIAFNRSLDEVSAMVDLLPASDRLLIEAGTPLIKRYGIKGIAALNAWWSERLGQPGYIVADLKCMDRGSTEVQAAAQAGAKAATCLVLAPLETILEFIKQCQQAQIDSMVDMMNVEFPFEVLQQLRPLPNVVVLHRGVDENELNQSKQLPLNQIHRIKGTYNNVLISLAGGETTREATSCFFNDAYITIVWRAFYDNPLQTAQLAQEFLELVK